jgi:hypothetical protein
VPLTADGMPQVTDNGKTWTVKLKKGIRFADDPVFGGKPRELVAEDVVYSLKRLIDPRMRSPWAFLVEGKFVGPRRPRGEGEGSRQVRLRHEDPRARGGRQATRSASGSPASITTCRTSSRTSRRRRSRAR